MVIFHFILIAKGKIFSIFSIENKTYSLPKLFVVFTKTYVYHNSIIPVCFLIILDSMPNLKRVAFGIFLLVFIDSFTITSNIFTRNLSYILHVSQDLQQ